MTFSPSPYQQAYFDWIESGSGNVIVEAVAGSGKTTTIVHGLDRMRGNVFLGAYNAKMGKELKERTAGKSGVFAGTFHSAGLRALKFAIKNERMDVDANKVRQLVQYLTQEQPKYRLLESAVTKSVSMAKQRGIGALIPADHDGEWEEMIEHFGLCDDLPEGEEDRIEEVIKVSRHILAKSNDTLSTIDFDDMVYLPLQKKIRMLQNDWVLIDEAQDTNPTRRALAQRMLRPNGRLVAVGDPYQAIFGFTGADNDSLGQIEQEFSCSRLPLTVTYRCPKAIVSHAQRWVPHIMAHDSAPAGEVKTIPYREMGMHLKAGDAILCRYNKYLVNLCFKLIRAGKPARIEGRQIGAGLIALSSKWQVRSLEELAKRVITYMNRAVEKAIAKGNEQKADAVRDQCETLLVLIERAQEQQVRTLPDFRAMVLSLFDDNVTDKRGMITLCSIHKAKGLEWDRVFLLGRAELQPSPYATKPWELQQETNLIYVAVTRAKCVLYEVTGVKEEGRQHSFDTEGEAA